MPEDIPAPRETTPEPEKREPEPFRPIGEIAAELVAKRWRREREK